MNEIPDDRRFFRIGEASQIIGVEPYTLRYWENEFPQLRPRRADSRQRTYQRKDLETLLEIKRLLYEERLTIEGARQRLRESRAQAKADQPILTDIKRELRGLLKLLG